MRAPEYVRFRLLRPPPIEFELFGQKWRIDSREVHQAGGSWRCSLTGGSEWMLAGGTSEAQLAAELTGAGTEMRRQTFVATVFRELERQGVVARIE